MRNDATVTVFAHKSLCASRVVSVVYHSGESFGQSALIFLRHLLHHAKLPTSGM